MWAHEDGLDVCLWSTARNRSCEKVGLKDRIAGQQGDLRADSNNRLAKGMRTALLPDVVM